MTALARAWNRWWFAPSARHQVGIFRIALLAWFVYLYVDYFTSLGWVAHRPIAFLHRCLGLRLSPIPFPWPDGLGTALQWIGWTTLFTSLLGIATRASLIVFTLVTFHLQGIRYSFGYFGHAHLLACLALAALAVAPGAGSWSVDALVRALRRREPVLAHLRGRPAPVWLARIVLIQIVAVYLAAGVAKLRYGGLEWLDGRTLSFYLAGETHDGKQYFGAKREPAPEDLWRDGFGLEHILYKAHPPPSARRLARHPWVCRLLAVASVGFELGFAVVLFAPRLVLPALVAAVAFHEGIDALMRIEFAHYYPVFALFVDWEALARKLRWKGSQPRRS